jgi:GTPase SAR1 family protein
MFSFLSSLKDRLFGVPQQTPEITQPAVNRTPYKVATFGQVHVGKTSIIDTFINAKWIEYKPVTIGGYYGKRVTIDHSFFTKIYTQDEVKLEMWYVDLQCSFA